MDRELVLEGTTGGKVAVPEMTEQVSAMVIFVD